jgi:cobalt-precorrin 5A hydrolase
MELVILAYTSRGAELGRKAAKELGGKLYVFKKYAQADDTPFDKAESVLCEYWGKAGILFISACGIAVRCITPFVKSKVSDSAVVVCDELGNNFISLLSGHIGGANELAEMLADRLSGNSVITTATDVNNKVAIDEWAVNNGLIIDNPQNIKHISAALLEGKLIGLVNETELISPVGIEGVGASVGIYIGCRDFYPFDKTLRLVPKQLCIGVGCRRGVEAKCLIDEAKKLFKRERLLIDGVATVATIDIKADEVAINELANSLGAELRLYTADELMALSGKFSKSEFVMKIVGVDCVCERAAVAVGAELIVGRHAGDGVTLAIGKIKG